MYTTFVKFITTEKFIQKSGRLSDRLLPNSSSRSTAVIFIEGMRRPGAFNAEYTEHLIISLFTSESTRNEFIDFYGKEWMDKIRVLNFGCSGLDSLDDLKSENKKESKQRLGIPVNSLGIACGYSSDPRQNHMEMINSILKVRDVLPQDVFLVFPMTYGAQEYSLQIESYLKKTTLHYKIFNQFLDAYDIARIRKVSDIMINIQDTDQLSCSMLEHMYAGGVIITGGWLPYDILTAKGAFLTTINSIRDVGAELLTIIHKIDDLQKLSIPNKSIVDQMERWDRNIKSWAEFFAGLKKKKI